MTARRNNESAAPRFDVFLSYDSRDVLIVEDVAKRLRHAGVNPWLDRWCLPPGAPWQEGIAAGLAASSACAVILGRHEFGTWEKEELSVALDRSARDPGFRVFLVLLPGAPEPFDPSGLSPFLSTRTWVDLRRGLEDEASIQGLINAAKGSPLASPATSDRDGRAVPYVGLRSFEEDHAEFFFGREADIQRVFERLKPGRFVAVVGPSGSGKSSIVRAGVLPSLRGGALPASDSWLVRVLVPVPAR